MKEELKLTWRALKEAGEINVKTLELTKGILLAQEKMGPSIDYLSSAFKRFVDFMDSTKPGEWSWNDEWILKEAK